MKFVPDRTSIAAGIVAALAILIYLTIVDILTKKNADKQPAYKAPEFKPFSNPITGGLLAFCLTTIGMALYFIIIRDDFFHGILLGMPGAFVWLAGYKSIPTKPRHAGLLMMNGSYLKLGGEYILVGGGTIVFPLPPFNLTVQVFNMTSSDFRITAVAYSKDNISLVMIIDVTLRPNPRQLLEFLQAGGMDAVQKQVDEIIVQVVQNAAKLINAISLVKDPLELLKSFGPRMIETLNKELHSRSFGVDFVKFQAKFEFSEAIRKAMDQQEVEVFERVADRADNETMYIEAEDLLAYHRKHDSDTNMTFAECLKEVKALRLIRQGKMETINTTGKGKTTVAKVEKDS